MRNGFMKPYETLTMLRLSTQHAFIYFSSKNNTVLKLAKRGDINKATSFLNCAKILRIVV
jgi:hypothetical protein